MSRHTESGNSDRRRKWVWPLVLAAINAVWKKSGSAVVALLALEIDVRRLFGERLDKTVVDLAVVVDAVARANQQSISCAGHLVCQR